MSFPLFLFTFEHSTGDLFSSRNFHPFYCKSYSNFLSFLLFLQTSMLSNMNLTTLMALAAVPLPIAFVIFYFLRSSKEMPTTWREFVCELKIQASGFIGLAEDTVLRFRNKVGEFFFGWLKLDLIDFWSFLIDFD